MAVICRFEHRFDPVILDLTGTQSMVQICELTAFNQFPLNLGTPVFLQPRLQFQPFDLFARPVQLVLRKQAR